ncbi:hypothetical protein JK358_12420 [Nocardia sp. 2]|uniref:Uncharacterized protein n=1 Tax=Nocardia acididurans TaxID=2802282 RepID=A0ABS1M3F8_9NOCA|nr:DUF6301 family protein [Nocardia acididurans]MBL1075197.1 hypothetical protein [Nocardia acididurans]
MTEWRASSDSEVVELAGRLRALEWSWQLTDGAELAREFGWGVKSTRANSIMLDTGFGLVGGTIEGRDGRADRIDVMVTERSGNDPERLRAAFTRMTTALSAALGEPTARLSGSAPEVRWAGPQTTLALTNLPTTVRLSLTTNERLARHDLGVEFERQGLL